MKLKRYIKRWQVPLTLVGVYLVSTFALLWSKLGTLPNGAADAELTACQASSSWSSIFHNIADAPYLILQNILPSSCSPDHQFWLRLPSTIIAAIAGALFILAVRRWLGRRTAWLAGILFITSAWFLHTGRLSTSSVSLLLVIPLLLAVYQRVISSPHSKSSGFIATISAGILLYIPGGIWFILASAVLAHKTIWKYIKNQGIIRSSLLGLVFLVLLSPVVLSLVVSPGQISHWLGLPTSWAIGSLITNILMVPVNLFAYGPGDSLYWLAHMPIMDVFASAMAILGMVWLFRHSSKQRQIFVIVITSLAWILSGFRAQSAGSLSLIVPLAYFFSAIGIQAMLRRWFSTFPRNPFARWLAYGLLILVIGGSMVLNVRAYYIAWPHTPAVIQIFSK